MPAKKNIPMSEILRLHHQGLDNTAIAEALGCSVPNVSIRLKIYQQIKRRTCDIQRARDLQAHSELT